MADLWYCIEQGTCCFELDARYLCRRNILNPFEPLLIGVDVESRLVCCDRCSKVVDFYVVTDVAKQ